MERGRAVTPRKQNTREEGKQRRTEKRNNEMGKRSSEKGKRERGGTIQDLNTHAHTHKEEGTLQIGRIKRKQKGTCFGGKGEEHHGHISAIRTEGLSARRWIILTTNFEYKTKPEGDNVAKACRHHPAPACQQHGRVARHQDEHKPAVCFGKRRASCEHPQEKQRGKGGKQDEDKKHSKKEERNQNGKEKHE